MIDCIKGFLQVNEDATGILLVIKSRSYFLDDVKKSMISGIFFAETELILIYTLSFIKEMFNSVVHDPFKYLADVRKQRDGSIVGTASFFTFFEDGTN